MELSLYLAKLVGLSLALIAGALLLNKKNVDLLFEIYSRPDVVFLTGILETILGMAFVLSHNIWTMDFRVIVTIIGWMLLMRGVERTLFSFRVPDLLKKFKKLESIFAPLLIFIFLVGAYLAYKGFTG